MVSENECRIRIDSLQKKLAEQGLDGALLLHPIDIYYYAGTRQNAVLWVPVVGGAALLVRKSLTRARQECRLDDVRPFPRSKEFTALFPAGARQVGMTFDVLPVQQYHYFAKLLPDCRFVDISAANRALRSVKSAWELERMRHAGARLGAVFAEVPEFLRPGMREVDLAAEFESRLRRAGGEGYVRMRAFNQELFGGLAVSGASAGEPGFFDGAVTGRGMSSASPHGASAAVINSNEPILLDYTGVFDGYIVDMTRMYVFGRLDADLQRAMDTALAIQERLAGALKPGAVCSELFATARNMAEEAGIEDHFMGAPGENARFVGHGVGLELDEMPVLAQGFDVPLEEGQTIAVEPKFVFPGRGVVGIENTFAVGRSGGQCLTGSGDAINCL